MTHPQPPDPNDGIRTAGTIALWIWIVAALLPIAAVVFFLLCCLGMPILGAFLPDPTPSP